MEIWYRLLSLIREDFAFLSPNTHVKLDKTILLRLALYLALAVLLIRIFWPVPSSGNLERWHWQEKKLQRTQPSPSSPKYQLDEQDSTEQII